MQELDQDQILNDITTHDYKFGFVTEVETYTIEKGLNEEVIRLISSKKNEPEWLLEFRLKAYRHWLTMEKPDWAHLNIPEIDFQDIIYYADPTQRKRPQSLDEVDPELLKTFERLGIPLNEQKQLTGVAVDAVMDSVSVKTTFKEVLAEKGIIFSSFSEAVKHHPDLVKKYLATVVPYKDNFYAALNSAVFSDGSFVYVPKGVRCPMELSTYFRINAQNTGQFERTLIVADDNSYVSYLEGCTAPMRDENQLHAAVVEIVALENAEVKYSTVQNWYPGDKNGKGEYTTSSQSGVSAKATTRRSPGHRWRPALPSPGNTPPAFWRVTTRGEFYSVAVTNNYQQADTGTKMIHLGRTPEAASSPRVFRQETAKTVTGDWSKWRKRQQTPATTRSATACCLPTIAVLTLSPYRYPESHRYPGT